MKKLFLTLFTVAAVSGVCARADDEDNVIGVLQSAATQPDKEAACLRLKGIGTAKSVPILQSLLTDENLSQWALDALETMSATQASDALLTVLPSTTGKAKAGVSVALGLRRETRAVPELAKLVSDADVLVAVPAARALGKIGGDEAVAALRSARAKAPTEVRTAIANGLLNCAEKLAGRDPKAAFKIYEEFSRQDEPAQIRVAAFRGKVLASKEEQANLIVQALRGRDEVQQAAAIQLVRELPDRKATAAFAEALQRVGPIIQVALIEALNQRDDPAAAKSVAVMLGSDDAGVRMAAMKALGNLGDATHVGVLAQLAANGSLAERAEARSAMIGLHRGSVLAAILAEIPKAALPAKVELIQTLARRGERTSVPELFRLAKARDRESRVAAMQALEKLADDRHAQTLLDLVAETKDDSTRAVAVSAFVTVASRSKTPSSFSELALNAMPRAPIPARCSLLEAAGQIGGPNVLDALRAAVKDNNPEISRRALKVMADNAGDEARPDLLRLSREAATDDLKAIALWGYWRLVEAMNERPQAERFAAVRAGLEATKSSADLKLGLARLAELSTPTALELAQRFRRDASVRVEAESACLQIITHFSAAEITVAEAGLRELAKDAESAPIRSEAKTFATRLEAQSGYIAPWLVSGPYRQEGKEVQQLFEVAFPPESPGTSGAEWRPLGSASNLTNWWLADLAQVAGGNHCVVYLKARVFCPKEQPVSLEIGTDDGVKLWINGALVHANNAVRGFTAGQDRARATLKEGRNDFLVKITQHTLGCAAAIRVRDADGSPLTGMRVEASN